MTTTPSALRAFARGRTARYVLSAVAGVGMVGALAGCSATASEETDSGASTSSSSASASAAPSDTTSSAATTDDTSAASTSTYTDGSYSASGSYTTPQGTEEIDVTITLEADVVTAVEITSSPSNPNTKQYQGEFVDGIDAVVVGKNIDDLDVSKVGGSSLTSGGFNSAVDEIKAEAAA